MTEPPGLRTAVRNALEACSQGALDGLAALAGIKGHAEAFEQISKEELAKLPHDLHAWWEGPCNCDRSLN